MAKAAEIGLDVSAGGAFDRADERAGENDVARCNLLPILFHPLRKPEDGCDRIVQHARA